MSFALVNEKMERRMFLCGTVDLPIGEGLAISPIIFNAMTFDTEEAAQSVQVEMRKADWGGDWEITQIGEPSMEMLGWKRRKSKGKGLVK